jgi:NAD(P)-dependent dehydrogenase (short-subunit alcohol dehydrogenase family)
MSERIALVTGGGRGIGANVARVLAQDGWRVVVAARSRDQVDAVAAEVGGRALELDVTSRESVERAVAAAGPVELLVANAGVASGDGPTWEQDPATWWRTFEVNVLGVNLCCSAVIPGMLARGAGRIVITGSGASYLPGASATGYPSSKAAVGRYAETLNNELEGRIPVFLMAPGMVRTELTASFPDDAAWTPPELAPELVRKLASGKYDALAGRYLHAEHDDVDDLLARIDEIRASDLNAIRIRR